MGDLLLPVGPRRMSSWEAHQHRNPRSTEPGTDFYCPVGTPVYAPADGRVYGWGDSIIPATGRWVGLDLTNGQRFRAMHFSRIVLSKSILQNRGFVRKGQLIAYSGATGYGENDWSGNPATGGAHTHVTLWPTQVSRFGYQANGKPYTIDFMKYADTSSSAGGGAGEEEDMTPEQDQMLRDIRAMLYAGSPSASKESYLGAPGTIYNLLKTPVTRAIDGVVHKIPQIQDNADTNSMVRLLRVQVAGLDAALKTLAVSQGADPDAILQAVNDGVKTAMEGVTFTASVD